jgi:anti-sigma regulatory factor (Ser/Thr protein kinase)
MTEAGGQDVGTRHRSMAVFSQRVESASEARRWLGSFLHDHGVEVETVMDATLVVSELVTNALRHGDGEGVLRASVEPGEIQLSVTDSGDAEPRILPPDRARIGGLGLVVVDRLAADWGVAAFPGGKTVWAVLTRPEI